MAAAVQLEIQGDTGTFTFDVEGVAFPRLEAQYKTSANPPEIVGLREVWEVRGARLVAGAAASEAAGTAALWAKFVALRGRVATRGAAFPTFARFVVPGGAVLHTIGPATHEGFVIESLGGEVDPDNPAATWRQTATLTLVFSAVQRFADVNGVVGWEQTVESSYPDGRHRLEWRTRITTAEGVSAATKALALAAIDASALGATYLYETGGVSGAVDLTSVDADEKNVRTATVVEAVSRVRNYGTTIGSVSPGAAPAEVSFSITTSTTADEQFTTTTATAQGPGALQFVLSKAPVVFNESSILDEQALMFASGTWTQRSTVAKSQEVKSAQTSVTVSGGERAVDFEPVADAGAPILFVGAFLPVTGVVDVDVDAIGVDGTLASMPLPGHPGEPWVYDSAASSEGEPRITDAGATPDKSRWKREARLVFRCAAPPQTSLGAALAAAAPRPSYVYG